MAERNRSDDERAQEEQPSDGQGNAHSDPAAGLKNKVRSHPVIAIAAIVLVVAGLAGAGIWWLHARHFETTDDAFIDARQFSIAPKVQGYIVDVPVTDNQHVGKGAILLRIDDRDYQVAAEQAEAEVAAAQASIANIDAQISAQMAQVEQAESNVREAEAARNFSAEDAARYQKLAALGTGSVQKAQQTASQLQQQDATVARAKAGVNAAQKQVSSLQAQRNSAVADRLRAEAQRDQATLNLGYTTIVAAQSGHVVHLSAAKGGYVEAGQSVMMFVPDEIWVTANFKETQITDMRPGQPVDIEIDAYPKTDFHGHVVSLQTGSGTAFSLLPAENATGNFVKVVQRVPVKIAIDNLPPDLVLGPGLSVVPSVRVR
ncbi:MAG TPA: HlyD family secretion protein [Terriglobia bacterium]|nr:HlyD family secretion protein [Terriglobia bacterium]